MTDAAFRKKFTRQPAPLDDQSKMPFGKHKGELMHAVPRAYLEWFVANCEIDRNGGQNPWWPHIKDYLAATTGAKVLYVRHPDRDARR